MRLRCGKVVSIDWELTPLQKFKACVHVINACWWSIETNLIKVLCNEERVAFGEAQQIEHYWLKPGERIDQAHYFR